MIKVWPTENCSNYPACTLLEDLEVDILARSRLAALWNELDPKEHAVSTLHASLSLGSSQSGNVLVAVHMSQRVVIRVLVQLALFDHLVDVIDQ